jgi:hypothetical protein
MSLARRIDILEHQADMNVDGPTLAERLREALAHARQRHLQGLSASDDPPCYDGPLRARLKAALARAQQASARLEAGEPGPW